MSTEVMQPRSLDDIRMERAKLSLRFGIYALIANGLFWIGFDIVMGFEPLYVLYFFLIVVTGLLYYLYNHASYRITAFVSYAIIFAFAFLVCLFDIPEPEKNIPRSQNLFFVVLAMYAYILFYSEKKSVQAGLAILSVSVFIFFRFSDFAIPEQSEVPANIRWYLAVAITISACLAIAAMIHIIHEDLQTKDESAQQLRQAIFENQLELYYQPQVNEEGKPIGAEALIRWNHPTMGILAPDKFIPYAEKTGGIIAIGEWILQTACTQLKQWEANPDTKDLILSINVSAPEIQQKDFTNKVMRAIDNFQIRASRLKFEITETALLEDLEDTVSKMNELSNYGILFTLDDFGMGYSSLNVLKTLPLKEIKIDKSFVDDIKPDDPSPAMIDSILNLCESMNIGCISEGVENAEQVEHLVKQGCFRLQGYYFTKTRQAKSFEQYILKQKRDMA